MLGLDAVWEIIREVAAEDPTYETGMGDVECFYCSGDRHYGTYQFDHSPECIVTRSRALVAEIDEVKE